MNDALTRDAGRAATLPRPLATEAAALRELLVDAPRLIVLDDDPTGTQTVHDVPVLTRWSTADVEWAFAQGAAGFFVLTNTRALQPHEAAARVDEVATVVLEVAERLGERVTFLSLWQAMDGPADEMPNVVFPGNVGDGDALTDVSDRLEAARSREGSLGS